MSFLKHGLKLGALGGPNTFGGDAARQLMALYPEFTDLGFHHTAEDGFAYTGGTDAMCAPQQMARTGFHAGVNSYVSDPGSKLYVIADVNHVYHCCLLARPGTKLEDIREIRGHTGSITQSRPWLEQNLPWAKIHIVHTSSHEAAREALGSDGSIASVGTPGMAAQFELEKVAEEIDGGSSANYWAISPHALFSDTPDRVVVSGRFDDNGDLGRIVTGLAGAGYHLESVFAQSSTLRVYEYDFNLRFRGKGALADVKAALAKIAGARLSGAYEIRE